MTTTPTSILLTYTEVAERLNLTPLQVSTCVARRELTPAVNDAGESCITMESVEEYQYRNPRQERTLPFRAKSTPRAKTTRKPAQRKVIELPTRLRLAIVHASLIAECGTTLEHQLALWKALAEDKPILRDGKVYTLSHVEMEQLKEGVYAVTARLERSTTC